jgi:hypothetical protein
MRRVAETVCASPWGRAPRPVTVTVYQEGGMETQPRVADDQDAALAAEVYQGAS